MNVIELKNVSKSYLENGQKKTPLDKVNLTIQQGEIIHLCGDNGAGKSTLVELLLGLRQPDTGTITLFGRLPNDPTSRLKLGCMLQKARAPEHLKIEELINLIRSYYPQPLATEEILQRAKLQHKRYDFAAESKLSGGEASRLYFALAIAGDPDLLILDEPTTALSPAAAVEFWEQVQGFISQGKTIVIITQIKSEQEQVDALATRILTLHEGHLQEVRTPRYAAFQTKSTQDDVPVSSLEPLQLRTQQMFSSLVGQLRVELLELIRNPVFLSSILALYSFVALFSKTDPNVMSYVTGLAAINLLLVAVEKFGVKIAAERTQGWTRLLRVTPLAPSIYLTAKVIVALIISLLGLGLMFGLGAFVVQIPYPLTGWIVLCFSLLVGVLPFAIIGCATGYLFDAKSISLVSTLILGLALFTSVPLPGMPPLLQNLMPYSPFYHYGQLAMWAGQIKEVVGQPLYDGHLGLHLEWLGWTGCLAGIATMWAYRRDQAIG
jgi:ABC-2 type transport system ATP-binding protein